MFDVKSNRRSVWGKRLQVICILAFVSYYFFLYFSAGNPENSRGFFVHTQYILDLLVCSLSGYLITLRLLSSEDLIKFDLKKRFKITKCIDYIWYTVGLSSAVLAVLSTQSSQISSWQDRVNLSEKVLLVQVRNLQSDAVKSCEKYPKRALEVDLKFRLLLDDLTSEAKYDPEEVCKILLKEKSSWIRWQVQSPLFPDERQGQYLSIQQSEQRMMVSLINACGKFFDAQVNDEGRFVHLKNYYHVSKYALDEEVHHVVNFIYFCNAMMDYHRGLVDAKLLSQQKESYFWNSLHPWAFTMLLSFLVGMKLAKTSLEVFVFPRQR